MTTQQLDLAIAGRAEGAHERLGEFGAGDDMPDGPYSIGFTHWGDGHDGPPWTVRCGDGRAVAGHVPSREIAAAIVGALNAQREGRE